VGGLQVSVLIKHLIQVSLKLSDELTPSRMLAVLAFFEFTCNKFASPDLVSGSPGVLTKVLISLHEILVDCHFGLVYGLIIAVVNYGGGHSTKN
jgi:hypothetical protein